MRLAKVGQSVQTKAQPVPQRHGSANKSIGGIYADKSTVTVAEGGAVQGNKASMGGAARNARLEGAGTVNKAEKRTGAR